MYLFDSYVWILYKLIVSPSVHANLHACSKTAQVINLVCLWRRRNNNYSFVTDDILSR